jgi:hypothetical protein
MNWSQFQDTAERLAHGKVEGDWRSAISRGYYAVFHYFQEFLKANGLEVRRSAQSHFNVYSGLLNCGFPEIASVASRIDGLRAHRVWADYNLSRPISMRGAQSAVNESRTLIADFQNQLGSLSPAPIVDGARRHLQSIGRIGP